MILVKASELLKIESESDVYSVRTRVYELAVQAGFDTFTTAALTTATSELTRNVWVHAGKGTAKVEQISDGARIGFRITFIDSGPGIEDIDRVLDGGYSTAKSLGLGLFGSRRLVDSFDIQSQVGRGTTIVITKWARDKLPGRRM